MNALRHETGQLEIRIGVVEHCLIQAKLSSKTERFTLDNNDVSDPILGGGSGTTAGVRSLGAGATKQIVI